MAADNTMKAMGGVFFLRITAANAIETHLRPKKRKKELASVAAICEKQILFFLLLFLYMGQCDFNSMVKMQSEVWLILSFMRFIAPEN